MIETESEAETEPTICDGTKISVRPDMILRPATLP
jgi:hypothetical protein